MTTPPTNASSVSKTDAIRKALAESETGSPSQIANTLKQQGIDVSAAYVSTIKTNDKKRTGGSTDQPVKRAASTGDLQAASELLLKAVDLVLTVGGDEAKRLIDAAEKMVERVRSK